MNYYYNLREGRGGHGLFLQKRQKSKCSIFSTTKKAFFDNEEYYFFLNLFAVVIIKFCQSWQFQIVNHFNETQLTEPEKQVRY